MVEDIIIPSTALVSRFDTLTKRAKISDKSAEQHSIDIKVFDSATRDGMYQTSLEAWQTSFDPSCLSEQLTGVQYGNFDLMPVVKQTRKFGLILNSANLLLNETEAPNTTHKGMIWALGQVADHLHTPQLGESIRGAQKWVEAASTNQDFEYTPVSDDTFASRFQAQLGNGPLNDGKSLQVVELHRIRKSTRHIMNLYQLRQIDQPSDANERTFQYIYWLNKDLGGLHDDLVARDLKGEIDYNSFAVDLPPDVFERLQKLRNAS